jgi:hypothetical protein
MPLSASQLQAALESTTILSSCPTTAAEAASNWANALTQYFLTISTPLLPGVASIHQTLLVTELSQTIDGSTDAALTFAPVDKFIQSIAATASVTPPPPATPMGVAVYNIVNGRFGEYALEGVVDLSLASEAAEKIARNVHTHITNILNCSYTATGVTVPVPWS